MQEMRRTKFQVLQSTVVAGAAESVALVVQLRADGLAGAGKLASGMFK